MKKFNSLFLALLMVLAINGLCYGWGSQGGDGSDYKQLQETAVFFNNSGETLSAGQVVILDVTASAASTLGSYVTIAPQVTADSVLAIGIVKSVASLTGTPVVVVTKGPVEAQCADSSDAVSASTAVGSTGAQRKGQCGGGTNLGIALEAGPGTDASGGTPNIYIWVDPTGAD